MKKKIAKDTMFVKIAVVGLFNYLQHQAKLLFNVDLATVKNYKLKQ